MPLLRTKIKAEPQIPATTGWTLGQGTDLWIDNRGLQNFMIGRNSTRLEYTRSYRNLSPKASAIEKKLWGFLNLPQNWDNNEAVPPLESTLKKAVELLKILDEWDLPITFSAPGPNGEVLLEYRANGSYAEIYFEPEEEVELILYRDQDQAYCGAFSIDLIIEHFSLNVGV